MCRCLRLVLLIVAVPLGLAVGVQGGVGDLLDRTGTWRDGNRGSRVQLFLTRRRATRSQPRTWRVPTCSLPAIRTTRPNRQIRAMRCVLPNSNSTSGATSPPRASNKTWLRAALSKGPFSAGALQAAIACLPTNSCDLDGGNKQNIACFEQHLATATPTAAQKAVAVSFCAQCRPDAGAASCESAFFDIADDAGNNIIGFLLLEVSDTTATNIETACTGAFYDAGNPLGCAARFFVCADRLALLSSPGDACRPATVERVSKQS